MKIKKSANKGILKPEMLTAWSSFQVWKCHFHTQLRQMIQQKLAGKSGRNCRVADGVKSPRSQSRLKLLPQPDAKKWEIEAWRTEQEAQPFTFRWNGHTWNGGPDSLARLYPVVMAAGADSGQWDVMTWSDADNQQVKLSMTELEELAAAMAQAQVDRNNEIYRHQREMKEELSNLLDLKQVREFSPE